MRVKEVLLKIDNLDMPVIAQSLSGCSYYWDSVQDLINDKYSYIKDCASVLTYVQRDLFGNDHLFVLFDVNEV